MATAKCQGGSKVIRQPNFFDRRVPSRLAGTVAHSTSTTSLLVRVVVAFALTYLLGYERELRGSPAGDRTFSLIGAASAVPEPGRRRLAERHRRRRHRHRPSEIRRPFGE
jgi:hypothetical protein